MPDDQSRSGAADIAREVNAHILALEARLHEISVHAREADQGSIGLFCECGCMGIVASTRADYSRSGGVWLEGHEPPGTRSAI